jgi:pSer/pThr/pTyr-binding forkhead associated (FHA) protein
MLKKLGTELIRRGVLRALGAYIAIVWLLAQGVVDVFPALGLPAWTVKGFLVLSIAATPLIALVSWKYDLTRKGLLRDRGALPVAGSAVAVGGGPTRRSNLETQTTHSTVQVSWTGQDGRPREQEFSTQFIVGRDYKADVRIPDERVSRRHVKVYPAGDEWFVKDLASLNGSYVDGLPIDVRKIDHDTSVSLDKGGPVIKLSARIAEPTRLTVKST